MDVGLRVGARLLVAMAEMHAEIELSADTVAVPLSAEMVLMALGLRLLEPDGEKVLSGVPLTDAVEENVLIPVPLALMQTETEGEPEGVAVPVEVELRLAVLVCVAFAVFEAAAVGDAAQLSLLLLLALLLREAAPLALAFLLTLT